MSAELWMMMGDALYLLGGLTCYQHRCQAPMHCRTDTGDGDTAEFWGMYFPNDKQSSPNATTLGIN